MKKSRKPTNRGNGIRQNLFEFAVMILAVKNIIEPSTLLNRPEWVDMLFIMIFLGAILWKLALQTYTMTRIIIFVGFGLLCTFTCIIGNYFYLLFSYLCIIAMQDVDLKKVLMKTSIVKMILLLIHVIVFFAFMMIAPDKIDFAYRNGIQRWYFMLGHPNTFSMYVLWSSLEYVYASYEKLRIRNLLLIWLVNAIAYIFTNSNTSIMVSTFVVTILVLDKWGKKKHMDYLNPVSKYCFTACTILFPLLIASYTKLPARILEIFYALDSFFTGRLLYGAFAYDVYGVSLFGRHIVFAEKSFWKGHWLDTIIFDNAYIWMFIIYGYFYLIVISAVFILISNKTTVLEKVLIIAFSFYGIMEAYIMNAAICFPLLIVGKYLYLAIREKRKKKITSKYRIVNEMS